MKQKADRINRKKSIFKALFIPLFVIMILQAVIFYVAAVYGGIEETMNQNASDIFTERLNNRKNEVENMFVKSWMDLSVCEMELDSLYGEYMQNYGEKPFCNGKDAQISFLSKAAPVLIKTLRNNGVNGIFLILNDKLKYEKLEPGKTEEKIGLNLRDLDQTSNYTDTEDLLVERSPSAVVEELGCSLDSWWESRYRFVSEEKGAFYYEPLRVAWENPDVDSENLAYFEGKHRISSSDPEVISYSIPLMDEEGYPYAVLGIELTTKYLGTLLPSSELDPSGKSCYVLALDDIAAGECTPIIGNGSMYSRCVANDTAISLNDRTEMGGFFIKGSDGTLLYGNEAHLEIYNNNSPFEEKQLTLIALIEEKKLFSYITKIKKTLALVSMLSLLLGLGGMLIVSRHFSKPITALAKKVQTLPPRDGFTLERLGITEIDQLVESIEELNRNASRNIARTEFFSRMSHDMRTPMNAIISFSSKELLEYTTEAQKVEYMQKIHTSGEYLLGLINEVLDMTKIESDKIDLHYMPIQTTDLWNKIFPIIEELALEKNINFHKDINMEKVNVMADEQHLDQIVMNLLSNAVKFTPAGGNISMKVTAKTDALYPSQLVCKIVISDSGIGMSKEFQKNLYHPFEQENDGQEGTGLGLSIAKKLMDLMEGTIECSSEKFIGTTFTLNFNLKKCNWQEERFLLAKQQGKNTLPREQERLELLWGKQVLVCEDHPMNAQIIQKILERVGIEVTLAEDGAKGLDAFQNSKEYYFDAILMDIRMPIMNGLEATRKIRQLRRKDAMVIPIIAMTANAFLEDVNESRSAGMNAHLSKPVELEKLYETLQLLIGSNQKADA